MKLKITVGKIPDIRKIIGNINAKRSVAFSEISPLAKKAIIAELRSRKSGVSKSRNRASRFRISPARRSAWGESLARDTGASEKLITTQKVGNNLNVGFLENPYGFNYVAFNEIERNRPTVRKAKEKTLPNVIAIIGKNFKL
jgi:hypothetical protein